MKWKEFKELVNSMPSSLDECEVILQKDVDGYEYSPLIDIEQAVCIPEEVEEGEEGEDVGNMADIYCLNWTAAEALKEEDEWEALKNDMSKRCIVLCPAD